MESDLCSMIQHLSNLLINYLCCLMAIPLLALHSLCMCFTSMANSQRHLNVFPTSKTLLVQKKRLPLRAAITF